MPVPVFPEYPLLNGTRCDWSSVFFDILGARMIGLKELSFNDSLEPGIATGTAAQPIGRTDGVYAPPEVAFTCYTAELQALLKALGDGYYNREFNITVKFQVKKGDPIRKIEFLSCRIKKIDESHSQSNEALVAKIDLSVMLLIRDGIKPMDTTLGV